MDKYVFVSYASEDRKYVRSLVHWLRNQGFDVWYDEGIDVGKEWATVVREQVDNCAVVIVVMTPDSADSRWVDRELERADVHKTPVMPLLLKGTGFRPDLQHEDVRGGGMPSQAFVEALAKHAPPKAPPPKPELRDDDAAIMPTGTVSQIARPSRETGLPLVTGSGLPPARQPREITMYRSGNVETTSGGWRGHLVARVLLGWLPGMATWDQWDPPRYVNNPELRAWQWWLGVPALVSVLVLVAFELVEDRVASSLLGEFGARAGRLAFPVAALVLLGAAIGANHRTFGLSATIPLTGLAWFNWLLPHGLLGPLGPVLSQLNLTALQAELAIAAAVAIVVAYGFRLWDFHWGPWWRPPSVGSLVVALTCLLVLGAVVVATVAGPPAEAWSYLPNLTGFAVIAFAASTEVNRRERRFAITGVVIFAAGTLAGLATMDGFPTFASVPLRLVTASLAGLLGCGLIVAALRRDPRTRW